MNTHTTIIGARPYISPGMLDRINPAARGYAVIYRGGDTVCPGCQRSHWHVGRLSAECAFCSTALPLPESATAHARPIVIHKRMRPDRMNSEWAA